MTSLGARCSASPPPASRPASSRSRSSLTSDHAADDQTLNLLLGPLVGWAFIGAGLVAWWRRPDNRFGSLMTAVGLRLVRRRAGALRRARACSSSASMLGAAAVRAAGAHAARVPVRPRRGQVGRGACSRSATSTCCVVLPDRRSSSPTRPTRTSATRAARPTRCSSSTTRRSGRSSFGDLRGPDAARADRRRGRAPGRPLAARARRPAARARPAVPHGRRHARR